MVVYDVIFYFLILPDMKPSLYQIDVGYDTVLCISPFYTHPSFKHCRSEAKLKNVQCRSFEIGLKLCTYFTERSLLSLEKMQEPINLS